MNAFEPSSKRGALLDLATPAARPWFLFARFEERIEPEFYRLTGKIRFLIASFLLLTNLTTHLQVERFQLDMEVYQRLAAFNLPTHLLDAWIGVWIWKGNLSLAGMRRATYAGMIIETSVTLVALWAFGSVSSHMLVFPPVLTLLYRLAFDFRIGLTAFLILFLGHWGIVIFELAGVLPPQPLALRVNRVYEIRDGEVGAMMFISIMLFLMFVISHWIVARMRFKDVAIRMLRQSLHVARPGAVGQHTGRTLADTYLVQDLLGSGGMGEVYKGIHQRTRREVAIKLLHPHLVQNREVLRRFQREAEITGTLGSRHIVEIFDVNADEGQPFLVLELLRGETLGTRIAREGALPLPDVLAISKQLERGLSAAHQVGVVHRDLKPENIFLCEQEDGSLLVKILDFGVSKIRGVATTVTQEVAILGTPEFMSPEQAVALTEDVDHRTDIFAMAGLLYCALTGRKPFVAVSIPVLLRRICEEQPLPLAEQRPDLPKGVADVLTIALAKRPEERYSSVSEFVADFEAASTGAHDPARTARAQQVTRGRPATRQPSASASAADTLALQTGSTVNEGA